MTKEIPLTRGMVALVDDEDYERVNKLSWYLGPSIKGRHYARSTVRGTKSEILYMHRFVTFAKNGQVVDHANGDTLDNRKINLRICNQSQNMGNSKRHKRNKSGFKGVYLEKRTGKYVSSIKCNKKFWIGSFDTAEKAARAYDAKARELFGEFARCNFPEETK